VGVKVSEDSRDAGETRLQDGEMQGSSGSTEFHYLIVFEVVSSSSSSVGVMQVEDTRRVTQAVLAMAMAVPTNGGWQWTPTMAGNGCQRWLAMDANDDWQWMPTVVGKVM